ncbi:MAG TPA: prepilin-type N-terminal cleavage/methylation domain-containing protein [Verrucomicrobiae bacterium]|jgi:prepilin-type N-terminal cleavage/methylation domain-containing protein|nr:prepilin-type N-terminal cleavage/methylation domain-containing protein [Verrucomicrobiae bacterium]
MKTLLQPPNGGGVYAPSNGAAAGFNLIELLVVITIIAVMAALLLPAITKAKQQATAAACLGNQKQLAAALHMYTQDNSDRVVQMADYVTGQTFYPAGGFWAGPEPGPNWSNGTDALAAAVTGLQSSNALYFYCNNIGVYHCPGDTRVLNIPTTNGPNGWAYDSYSRTENIGGEPYDNYFGAGATYTKMSAISQPSGTFSMMEAADWRGYNVGTWVVQWNRKNGNSGFTWEGPPATWHINVCTVGFADGHGELHKWTDSGIINAGQRAGRGIPMGAFNGPTNGPDYDFVYNGYLFPGHP